MQTIEDVQNSIHSFLDGNDKDLNRLSCLLRDPEISDEDLVICLAGLRQSVALIGKRCEFLVGVILRVSWMTRTSAVIAEYQALITALVSVQTVYLKSCLRMIVTNFMPVELSNDGAKSGLDLEDITPEHVHLHTLLKSLLKVVPMCPLILLPLMSSCFPYLTRDTCAQISYVKNLLLVTEYLPTERVKILELVLDGFANLDVRCPRHVIQESEEDQDEAIDGEDSGMFAMEEDDCGQVVPSTEGAHLPTLSSSSDNIPMAHKEANKLDLLMFVLFEFIDKTCQLDKKVLPDKCRKLFRELMICFEKIILPTHASCHIQFVMFYICSKMPELSEHFLDLLWKKVQDLNSQPIYRQAAVGYISSFLARAKYVPVRIVKTSLGVMVAWLHRYISQAHSTSMQADVQHHGCFFSVCQAVFYLFAFRHKQLLQMPQGNEFFLSLKLQSIVTCRLNPLRVCLPQVAQRFASITRLHQLAFCDTIIEKNKRNTLPVEGETAGVHSHLTRLNPLDSFFPFDPYVLSKSSQYIHPLFEEYDGAVINQDEEIENDSMMSTTPEANFLGWGKNGKSPTSPCSPSVEFFLLGSSPGFKT